MADRYDEPDADGPTPQSIDREERRSFLKSMNAEEEARYYGEEDGP